MNTPLLIIMACTCAKLLLPVIAMNVLRGERDWREVEWEIKTAP
jgi:hypothetical protein